MGRPDRCARQPRARHGRERQRVLPVVKHARGRRLERFTGRALIQRLRRPHLLGRRDVDVPSPARTASRPRGGDERLPLPAARSRGAARRGHWHTEVPATRGRARSTAPSRSRRRHRSSARASTSSISPPTSRWPQWQYYLATGDKRWLAQRGWPVLSQAAAFWASRVARGSDGRYHIDHVTGPDEENPNVNDELYTNVAAKTTLQDADPQLLGSLAIRPPADWSLIASSIVVPDRPHARDPPGVLAATAGSWSSRQTSRCFSTPGPTPCPRAWR